jgi:hypothetical protein
LTVSVTALVIGGLLCAWLLKRFGRAVMRSPQPAVGVTRYVLTLGFAALFVGVGLAAAGLLFALQSYDAFTRKRLVAEVQCIEMSPGKLRVYLVPIDYDGATRGATETYDLEGDQWQVGADVLRFRPFLTVFGVETVYRLTRVEGRWVRAADANAHKPSAFDRGGGTTRSWLALYRDGKRGPLGWMIDGAHGQSVSQMPDRRAVYELYMTANGLVVNKRTF